MSRQRQIEVRRQRARNELRRYRITNTRPDEMLSLYRVRSGSGYTYDVEIRNPFELENRCSCPDYESNGLGTCKHIEAVLIWLEREHADEFRCQRAEIARRKARTVSVSLVFEDEFTVRTVFDLALDGDVRTVAGQFFTKAGRLRKKHADPADLFDTLREFETAVTTAGGVAQIGPEVWDFAEGLRQQAGREAELAELMERMRAGELEIDVLHYPLYPYQMLGTLFLAFTQRALLGDDMGLGKTIQAMAACIFLKRQGKLKRVLVICPASLKRQWAREIHRFCDESVMVIGGTPKKRAEQYAEGSFFSVLNYELVLRDFERIQALAPDMIILDEAQRIKNWRAKTTQLIKNLKSEYAYVLTGTPVENRLDELYSIVQFLDRRILGPAWQFMARHVVKDEWGAVIGYRELDRVKRKIAPIFLRRRKAEVLDELPERIDSTYYLELETAQARLYRPREAELRRMFDVPREEWTPEMMGRLLQLIGEMREICDAAQLVDGRVRASSKLAELPAIVEDVVVGDGHKALIFSQWERVTRLVEEALAPLGVGSVRLHGGLSTRQREAIIDRFTTVPDCRVFISTDAGGLGLNLQAADVVINVDLPWNPAKLEQRIARAHRIGQKNAVNVINLVVEDTIEERVQEVIYEKQQLFTTLFDTDIADINLSARSRVEELRAMVGALLGEEGVTAVSEPPAERGRVVQNIVFFDLETQRSFQEVGGRHNIRRLGVSVAVTYNTAAGEYRHYTEEMVSDLIEELKAADLVIGFNVKKFDYTVLKGYTDYPLAQLPTVDMLSDIYNALGFRVSLDNLAETTLSVSKTADGLQAIRWYRQGEMQKLIEYCQQDVEVTRRLYEFGRVHGYVQYRDKWGAVQRVRVGWGV